MKTNIKDEILQKIEEQMLTIDYRQLEPFSTKALALTFNASRNLVSQYLNEAFYEGRLIKVGTKPVYYLVKKHLNLLDDSITQYENVDQLLRNFTHQKPKHHAFSNLIGYKGSLSNIVQSCKSAMTYPSMGLPILLLGPTGVGKSYIAQLMVEYAKEKKVLDANARFITVNCSEYANNPEFFLTNLFGCKKGAYTGADKDREGLISLANGGVLFLDEVHCLSSECQEKLFQFMDKGIYHMVGDNDQWYSAKEYLIFATTENPQTALLKTLYRRIPIVTKIPSLSERPKQEKSELILYMLQKEADLIQKEIRLHQRLFEVLVHLDYSENVGQLSNCIKACVANAYMNFHQDPSMILGLHHLPEFMIDQCSKEGFFSRYTDEAIVSLDQLKNEQQREQKVYAFNRDLLAMMEENRTDSHFEKIRKIQKRFNQYLDSISFTESGQAVSQDTLSRGVIETLCQELSRKYGVAFHNNEIDHLARLLSDYRQSSSMLLDLQLHHEKQINELSQLIFTEDLELQQMTVDFVLRIQRTFAIESEELLLLDFAIYLNALSIRAEEKESRCIILSHGYSTASSMAAAANHMIDDHCIDAIDMPMDVNVASIALKLSDYIERKKNLKDLIILVDMGSLEDIYQRIQLRKHINLAIFNNVSIKLAMDIGFKLKQGVPVSRIKDSIIGEQFCPSVLWIENRKKEKAIVTVCSTGIATAEKISNLLRDSFPTQVNCTLIEASYEHLRDEKENASVFDTYDVQFIVGTLDPQVSGYDFISVEELVDQKSLNRIKHLMNGILDEKEMEQFCQNMIKNFSFQNLLDYLTILNPKKIVSYVEEIIAKIQKNLNIELSSNIVIGLYIHISCLIERLITDKYITDYQNIEEFKQTQQHFITVVKDAFASLEHHYCVEIPVSEIAYIYDYIYRLQSVENADLCVEDTLF